MKYLEDIGVDVEGLESLAVLQFVQAPAMGEMTRQGFVTAWSAAGYADTREMRQMDQADITMIVATQSTPRSRTYRG